MVGRDKVNVYPSIVPLGLTLALVKLKRRGALSQLDFRITDQYLTHGIAPHDVHVWIGVTGEDVIMLIRGYSGEGEGEKD